MHDDALALVAVPKLPRVRVPGFGQPPHQPVMPQCPYGIQRVPCGHMIIIEVKNS